MKLKLTELQVHKLQEAKRNAYEVLHDLRSGGELKGDAEYLTGELEYSVEALGIVLANHFPATGA